MERPTTACLPLYVINLKSSTQRLDRIAAGLERAGLAFERVEAVDGRDKAAGEFKEYEANEAARFTGRELNGAEVGCFLSHLRAARSFLATGAALGVVLEDDAEIATDFPEFLERFAAYAGGPGREPWHVVNMGANRMRLSSRICSLGRYELRRAHLFPVTTTGLLWSREGAEAFIAEGSRVFAPVDRLFRHLFTRSGRGLVLSPSPVRATGAQSQICAARNRRQFARSRLYWYRKQRRLISDKTFAFWHCLKAKF